MSSREDCIQLRTQRTGSDQPTTQFADLADTAPGGGGDRSAKHQGEPLILQGGSLIERSTDGQSTTVPLEGPSASQWRWATW